MFLYFLVSEPPDYDEALQIDSQGNPIPRRNSSRSSTGRHSSLRNTNGLPVRSASGYARSRPRVQRYNRSQSVTEGAPRSRYMYTILWLVIYTVIPNDISIFFAKYTMLHSGRR